MTTAAYKDGLLIADTRAYGFDKLPVGQKDKVAVLGGGSLACISTAAVGVPALVVAWLMAGRPEGEAPELGDTYAEVLVVHPDGSAEIMDGGLAPSHIRAPHYTIGSGRQMALAALHLGCSAPAAVGVACDLDHWTDFPLVGYTHDGERVTVRSRRELRAKWG